MIRLLARAAGCGLLAALLGAAFLAIFYAASPALSIEFDRDLPRLVGGLHPYERDDTSGMTFAWTREQFVLRLPGLDRRVNWTLEVRARGARPVLSDNPELSILADGILLESRQSGPAFEDMRFTIPARPSRPRDAVITIGASKTFSPGPADPRQLGFMLDSARFSPDAIVVAPRAALAGVALAAGILAAGVALLGFAAPSAAIAAVLIATGTALLAAKGFGPYTSFPFTGAWVALWVSLAMVATGRAVEWRSGETLRNTARFALAFAAVGGFMKLLVLVHPDLPIGDALFHAHRFRTVVDGNLFFTSVAPGNYQFPYAPGLYVAAAPFASMVVRDVGDMTLLRVMVVAFDSAAAALLYFAVVRSWSDRRAAAIAVALYLLVPLDLNVETVGNLTNAFAQALAVCALVMISSPAVRLDNRMHLVALTLMLAAGYMSHTSTFAILFPACVTIAAVFYWKGGRALRSPAGAVLITSVAAFALALFLYYGHFGETYRAEFARISSETAQNAPDAGGRTVSGRLAGVPRSVGLYFGVPVVLLAAVGARSLIARRASDRLSLAVLGWSVACLGFLALGILTPVDMRYYLASIPAFAIAGAAGASWLWDRGGSARPAAVALLAWASFIFARGVVSF
ncbi:MAG: hypothetical protein ABIS06_09250 [Vicinamibacterales bacterium]